MLTILQALILGTLQGVSELFPISSLGHSVLVPALLHWNIDQSSDAFLSFVVLTHLATALALLLFFYRDWARIIRDLYRSFLNQRIETVHARIGLLIVMSSLPVGLLGLLFQTKLQLLFAAPKLVALVLVGNGIMLFIAEWLCSSAQSGADDRKLARMSWMQAFTIGLAQCLALIPGLSRTGVTMAAGLGNGFSRDNAARYSFLLATPVIFAAALLKVPRIITHHGEWSPALVGFCAAFIAAYLSVRYLTTYFQTKTLRPFALYCIVAGIVSLVLLTM
ncbi:MAG TPA: undecaprenyl-diphosphate phosphatase [Candidatus Paceibacterota bacterium]|nr:undecaprenyl-diphosphate phosphatase [Candidatus Paceibacterota bacterium]